MCRFLGYLGPPVTLASIVLDPPHSLLRQAWQPRHQRPGAVNADGFGVGWYDLARRAEPARYRTSRPIWGDRSFASLAGLVASGAVLAALRDATPPAPIEESGTPPFTAGPWLFAHNGAVDGYGVDPSVRIRLRRLVSDERAAGVEGSADSELLFALALDALHAGAGLGEALAAVIPAVARGHHRAAQHDRHRRHGAGGDLLGPLAVRAGGRRERGRGVRAVRRRPCVAAGARGVDGGGRPGSGNDATVRPVTTDLAIRP